MVVTVLLLLAAAFVYLTDRGRDFSREGIEGRFDRAYVEAQAWMDRAREAAGDAGQTFQASEQGELVYGGLPWPRDGLTLLPREGFVVAYDEVRENPAWVAYKLEGRPVYDSGDRPSRFAEDDSTRARVEHDDYTGSGYDRGHMAPNYAIAVYYGPAAQEQTFLMSNIVPQDPDLNQGPWRELEETIANTYTERFDAVYVVVGPIYDAEREILPNRNPADRNRIEIPDAFFQIVVGTRDDQMRVMSVVMPQEISRHADWRNYTQSVDEVERLTGYDFMRDLPDDVEDAVERARGRAF